MSNVLGLRIALARKNRGWSQTRLAQAVNQAQTTISSWERGRTEPSRSDVQRIAQVLSVNIAQLEVGAGLALGAEPIPTGQIVFRDLVVSDVLQNGAIRPWKPNGEMSPIGLRIGDGAVGRKFSGWVVYYDPSRYVPDEKFIGSLCVVGVADGTVFVKWLEKSPSVGLFHLTSEIVSPLLDQRVIWLSPVVHLTPPTPSK